MNRWRFILTAKNHGYWKVFTGNVDFSEYEGKHSTEDRIGQALLELFSDSEYFPKVFYEDPVHTISIQRIDPLKNH